MDGCVMFVRQFVVLVPGVAVARVKYALLDFVRKISSPVTLVVFLFGRLPIIIINATWKIRLNSRVQSDEYLSSTTKNIFHLILKDTKWSTFVNRSPSSSHFFSFHMHLWLEPQKNWPLKHSKHLLIRVCINTVVIMIPSLLVVVVHYLLTNRTVSLGVYYVWDIACWIKWMVIWFSILGIAAQLVLSTNATAVVEWNSCRMTHISFPFHLKSTR